MAWLEVDESEKRFEDIKVMTFSANGARQSLFGKITWYSSNIMMFCVSNGNSSLCPCCFVIGPSRSA